MTSWKFLSTAKNNILYSWSEGLLEINVMLKTSFKAIKLEYLQETASFEMLSDDKYGWIAGTEKKIAYI